MPTGPGSVNLGREKDMKRDLSLEVVEPGGERELLAFLERDPVANLRLVWAVRRWGLFNLGLAEQGAFLAARHGGRIRGVLFRDNLGIWRLAAGEEEAGILARAALDLWGPPEAVAGKGEEVEYLLAGFPELSRRVRRREEEVTLVLERGRFAPRGSELVRVAGEEDLWWRRTSGGTCSPRSELVRVAGEEDLDSLVRLERAFQLEYLGSVSRDWEIRLRMLRLAEAGAAAIALWEGRVAAKAEMEAVTPRADELGGVYTLPDYRRRGLAAAACSLLCGRSLARGKVVRLEARRDNYAALSLYRGLGFRDLWPHVVVVFS